jgi:hypothetical protein
VPPSRAQPASGVTLLGSSFSRSYGCNLPSSLTRVLPIASVFSTCPPVSVWGTGAVPTHCWAFLGSSGSVTSSETTRHHVSGFEGHLSTTRPTRLPQDNHRLGSPTILRPPSATRGRINEIARKQPSRLQLWAGRGHGGTGISTGCASTTPRGLALAPDSPWADWPCPGTLGLPAEGVLTPHSLLMPAFSLDATPRRFTPPLHCNIDALLPLAHTCESAASALDLSPVTLSAQDHSTSELLRTLSRVAASKPTSWLSVRSHIVFHLVQN